MSGTISGQLEERFQKAIDSIAVYDGSAGSDEYLNYWGYGDYKEINKDLNSGLIIMKKNIILCLKTL